jgi:uncharacterized coiled-coil DUF342 family protein
MWTESVPLKEEKKYLLEIQELKRNKPKVTQVHKMEEGLQTLKEGVSMKDTDQEINKQMAMLREEKKGIQAKLTEIREARNAKLGDMPDIIKERDELSQLVTEKVKEKNQLRDDFKAAEKAKEDDKEEE